MYSVILSPQKMSYHDLRCSFVFDPKHWGQQTNLTVFIVWHSIIFEGDFQKTFWYLRLSLLKTWTSICVFAVLQARAVIGGAGGGGLMQKPMGMALCLCWQKTVCMYRMLYTVIVHRKSWHWSVRFTCYCISQGCLNLCFSNSLWFDPSGMMSVRSYVFSFCSGMLEMCPPHQDV